MAGRKLREPAVQMTAALIVAKRVDLDDRRRRDLLDLMLERGMKIDLAARRLDTALEKAGPAPWTFDTAWLVCWATVYWPHQTEARRAEQDALRYARREYRAAWYRQETAYSRMFGFLGAGLFEREELNANDPSNAAAIA